MSLTIIRANWTGGPLAGLVKESAMADLELGAEAILSKAVDLVPHDTGTLQRSGHVTVDEPHNAVYVSFNTPYALRQHEDMEFAHESGRTAKYLEKPFEDLKPSVEARVRRGISRVLGG